MALPSLTIAQQGLGSVGADDLNTKVMWAVNVDGLRAFAGLGGMTVWMQGTADPNDGGQGMFEYDPSATASDDDGATTIKPNGVTGAGRWIRQPLGVSNIPANSISLGQIQMIPSLTLLGNNTGSTGDILALTVAQVVAMLGGSTATPGTIVCFPASVAPTGWLVCDGSAVSRSTYAALNTLASAASYGDPWGPGNGSTTFNLPNLLGRFVRCWDASGSVDPGRAFGSLQSSALQSHVHITDTPTVYVSDGYTDPFGDTGIANTRNGFTTAGTGSTKYGLSNDGTTYSAFNPNPGGQISATETRPTNIALSFIIKT